MSTLTVILPPRKEVKVLGTAERRKEIMKILCQRRHETVKNLAFEFGVSTRTIRRDIDMLSLTVPIYTQTGRYCGGVYLLEDHLKNQIHMTDKESEIIQKVFHELVKGQNNILTKKELEIFRSIVKKYTKQINKEGIKDEERREKFI